MIEYSLPNGVRLFPLKTFPKIEGNVFHGLKNTDPNFAQFGEVYFSSVNPGFVKGWKKHSRMTCNLFVPIGEINFTIIDDRLYSSTKNQVTSFILSPTYYNRLQIEPGLWFLFQNKTKMPALVVNVADILHDPNESESRPPNDPYLTGLMNK